MMCFGLTMLMQWASAAPVRLVLRSAATPPARAMPSQIAGIFRPVGHQQADRLALLEAVPERPARVAVAACIVLGEGELLAVGEERDAVAIARRELFGDVGKDAGAPPRHRRHAHERTADATQEREVVLEALYEPHLFAECRRLGSNPRTESITGELRNASYRSRRRGGAPNCRCAPTPPPIGGYGGSSVLVCLGDPAASNFKGREWDDVRNICH